VGGFCYPAPPGPCYVLEHACAQLGSSASYNEVIVSSNKCNVIVGIYDCDPIKAESSLAKIASLLRPSILIHPRRNSLTI